MGRTIDRLSPFLLHRAATGMHADGGGLYLHVNKGGARSWIFRYMRHGRAREMGLGALHTVPLKDARQQAAECRRQLLDGIDPIDAHNAKRHRAELDAAREVSFEDDAKAYIEAHKAGWKNKKHADQWTSTLTAYVYPAFGRLPARLIDTSLVIKALQPIWTEKPETAARVRGRIESILDWAKAIGHRDGENPCRLRSSRHPPPQASRSRLLYPTNVRKKNYAERPPPCRGDGRSRRTLIAAASRTVLMCAT